MVSLLGSWPTPDLNERFMSALPSFAPSLRIERRTSGIKTRRAANCTMRELLRLVSAHPCAAYRGCRVTVPLCGESQENH